MDEEQLFHEELQIALALSLAEAKDAMDEEAAFAQAVRESSSHSQVTRCMVKAFVWEWESG